MLSALGASAARCAIAMASGSKASVAWLDHASPQATAASAFNGLENNVIAAAAWGPTARSSNHKCPPPGCKPIRKNFASKRADSPARRISQANARLKPAPTAGPFTAAIVGSVERSTRKKPSYTFDTPERSSGVAFSLENAANADVSAPAQNTVPAPVMTTAPMLSSVSKSSNAVMISSTNGRVIAFLRSGSSSVRSATRSCRSM